MTFPGNRVIMKCGRGVLFLTLLFSSCVLIVFHSLQFNTTRLDDSQKKPISVKGRQAQFFKFTQVLTMPGGDNVPSVPPWPIPPFSVLTEPWQLSLNDSGPRYITTRFFMSPGQGNLMFQYASMFGMAHRYNVSLVIPEGLLIRRAFRLSNVTTITDRLAVYFLKNWKRRTYPNCCRYYPDSEHLENGTNFALYGYFQSYKYFHNIRTTILDQFTFLPEIQQMALSHIRTALRDWPSSSPLLVGVHVRRGMDVIWNSRNQQHGHTVAGRAYFMKAMDYFRDKFSSVLFIVCSDDYYWVKEQLGTFPDVRIVNSKYREVDMCVLSMCNHTIMSQGTFSWWAAYLAGGQTVYYDGWPRPHSQLDSMVKKDDFFPPEWIPME